MKRLLTLLVLSMLVSAGIYAQTTVQGTVTDPSGEPLIGVTVAAKGTNIGTITDIDGKYSLVVPQEAAELTFTYTGYETFDVVLSGQTVADVTMNEGVALDEIVVTGYAVTSKRQATGAVSTVAAKELQAIPSGNVEQQLQGRAPGVTVITNGQPGTTSIIRVRGFTSFGGNQPLYVIDGVPSTTIDFLSPDDIESTSVLKDAATASIYGARAANGVIVIQTKRGSRKNEPLRVQYNGLIGITTPGEGQPILSPLQDAQKAREAIIRTTEINNRLNGTNDEPDLSHPQYDLSSPDVRLPDFLKVGTASGVFGSVDLEAERANYNIDPNAGPLYQVIRANPDGTDWYDAITRNALISRHTLGFMGSGEAARFYVSLSAQNQEGILLEQDFARYNFRANSEFDLGDRVRIGNNLQFTYRSARGLIGGGLGSGVARSENAILSAFRMNPIIPVFDEFGGYAGTTAPGFNNARNPVAEREGQANNRNFDTRAFGNLYAEVDVTDWLTLRSSVGGTFLSYQGRSYNRLQYENSENNSSFGYNEFQGYFTDFVITNIARFDYSFDNVHNFTGLVGIEALEVGRGRNSSGNGINPFSTSIDFVSLNTVQNRQVFSNFGYGTRFDSQFGQVNYNYDNKYYVSGTLRRDGVSLLSSDDRYGIFPAISAAWRVTSEDFMKNQNFITDLKIRGGWGEMGNINNVDPNNRFNLFGTSLGASSYDINGTNTSAAEGFFASRVGNPNARWETSVTTNIGFDATFGNGNFELIADLWRKESNGLLVQVPLPQVTGSFASAPSVNIGDMENSGIDLSMIYRNSIGDDFNYEVTLNGGFLKNEIVKFTDDVDFFDRFGTRISGPVVRNQVGNSLASFFGYQVEGLFQETDFTTNADGLLVQADGIPVQDGAAPGRFRFQDNNGRDENGELTGMPDGVINEADRTILGSAVPDFTGGFNLRLEYKGFDLNTYLYASVGNEVYNNSKWFTDFYPTFTGAAVSTRVLDSWTPQNTDTDVPVYENVANFSTSQQSNSYYVEDGSYLRLVNLSIGYNFADDLFNGAMRNARVAIAANNLFTITGYDGLDPAVGGAADVDFGIDVGNYPVTRAYNLSFGVEF